MKALQLEEVKEYIVKMNMTGFLWEYYVISSQIFVDFADCIDFLLRALQFWDNERVSVNAVIHTTDCERAVQITTFLRKDGNKTLPQSELKKQFMLENVRSPPIRCCDSLLSIVV